jgi:phosphoribosylglycinamide formyltransferase-1
MRIAVFVSGNGSNLQCLIDASQNGTLKGISIELVVADRNCFAIERAKASGIEVLQVERKINWSEQAIEILQKKKIRLIVLAGFLSIINDRFCIEWKNSIINLHPSLLPKYGGKGMYGLKVHEQVLLNNDKKSGATVHFVTEEIDGGQIIIQEKCTVDPKDTPETLAQKIHGIEKNILIESIKLLHAKTQGTN